MEFEGNLRKLNFIFVYVIVFEKLFGNVNFEKIKF